MSSFASLNAGMLARKGEARPSAEPQLANVLRTPTYRPREAVPVPARAPEPPVLEREQVDSLSVPLAVSAAPPAAAFFAPVVEARGAEPPVLAMKVKIDEALSLWPAKKPPRPAADNDLWRMESRVGLPPSPRHTERTSVRFTHAQARALKLAALLLDRPQQELIEAGVEGKLEALACTDLASCSCFKAVLATFSEH